VVIIRVLSGRLTKSGQLSRGTVLKLHLALFLANRLYARGVSYHYAFPQGRSEEELGQRPCDLMSLWVLKRDLRCEAVVVPEPGRDLITRAERKRFVANAARVRQAKVFRLRDALRMRRPTVDMEPGDIASEMVPSIFHDVKSSNVVPFSPKQR